MKKNPWKCNDCGSTEVDQEWSFFVPMNDDGADMGDEMGEGYPSDSFWCKECDAQTSPIRDEE